MKFKGTVLHLLVLQFLTSAAAITASYSTSLIGDVDLGYLSFEKGDYAEAKKCFMEALKANSRDARAYVGLARLDPNSQQSMNYCSQAIRINPKLADAYILRANGNAFWKDYQQAIDDYTRAINLHPLTLYHETIANQYILRGCAYESLGQPDKAMADLATAIKIGDKSDKIWAYQKRAGFFEKQNKYKESMADFDAAIKLAPKQSPTYSNRAMANLRFKKFNEAIADYTKVLAMEPSNKFAYAYRAKAYLGLGQKDLAQKDQKAAQKLGFKTEIGDFFTNSSSGLTVKDPKDLKGAL